MGKKKIIISLFIILGFCIELRTIIQLWNSNLQDFGVLYFATEGIIQGKNPYRELQLFTQVNYPPTTFIFLTPFVLMPYSIASHVWLLSMVVLFYCSIFFIYKSILPSKLKISILYLLSVCSFPFKFTLGMGQTNIIILFCITLFIWAYKKNKFILSFLMYAIAIVIKVFPVFYLIYFLKNKKRIFFSILFICGMIFLASIIVFGIQIHFYYFQSVFFPLTSSTGGAVYYNQSLTGLLARIGIPIVYNSFFQLIIVCITLVNIIYKQKSMEISIGFLIITQLIINAFTWQHHLLLLVIPFAILLSHINNLKQLVWIGIAYVLVASNIKNPEIILHYFFSSITLSHGFLGIIILWVIFYKMNSKQYV